MPKLEIDMDKKCVECGKVGGTPSGLCLKCVMKAMDLKTPMKSQAGKIVQRRFRERVKP